MTRQCSVTCNSRLIHEIRHVRKFFRSFLVIYNIALQFKEETSQSSFGLNLICVSNVDAGRIIDVKKTTYLSDLLLWNLHT